MKFLACFALAATLCAAFAAELPTPSRDPLAGAFFPPEAVMAAREQIELTSDQQEKFHTRMEKTHEQMESLRQRLEKETAALGALVKEARVDEQALKTQLDKVLDVERELKHLHLGVLAAVKNLLTPEQQAKLREMMKSSGGKPPGDAPQAENPQGEAMRRRLMEKVEQVQQAAAKWQEAGRDTSEIAKMMETGVAPLISRGKIQEADAALDKVLEHLRKVEKRADGEK